MSRRGKDAGGEREPQGGKPRGGDRGRDDARAGKRGAKHDQEAGPEGARGAKRRGNPGATQRGGPKASARGHVQQTGPVGASGHGAAPSQRQLRVAEEIRHLLAAQFLRHEFRDPDLADAEITVAEVRISPDLKHATAFISRLGRTDVDALLPALKRAAPWLRGQLAKDLTLRYAPELSFQPDHALDYAMKIDALMKAPEVARDLGAEADEEG